MKRITPTALTRPAGDLSRKRERGIERFRKNCFIALPSSINRARLRSFRVGDDGSYEIAVYGRSGFVRRFSGGVKKGNSGDRSEGPKIGGVPANENAGMQPAFSFAKS